MDRALILQHLADSERHVAEGERHIADQRARIAEAERAGQDAKLAKELLRTLEATQALHLADRDRLREELGKPV
jgi:hypothetical protein